MCSSSGLPDNGNKDFGQSAVNGIMRVPRPAASITARGMLVDIGVPPEKQMECEGTFR